MLLNSRFWNITVFGLAIISIILIIYEFLTPVVYGDISKIIIIDLGICVIFAIDFFYRLINSNDRGKYLKFHGFEILAFIPSLIFNLIDSEILIAVGFRSVRMMRVLVVSARLLRFKSVSAYFVAGSKLIYLSIMGMIIVSIGGFGVFIFESNTMNAKITSLGDAFWWSLATVTTVGYGDVVPISAEGRILGVLIMTGGIAFISVFISVLGAELVQKNFQSVNKDLKDSTRNIIKNKLDNIDKLKVDELRLLQKLMDALIDTKINKNKINQK